MSFRSIQTDRDHDIESVQLHRQLCRQRSNSLPNICNGASGDVYAKDSKGRTLLFYAAKYGQTEIARQLLDAGCDPNIADHNRNTPLHEATDGSHIDIVKLLIKYDCDINTKNLLGQTALMRAVIFDDDDIVKLLYKSGANIEETDCTGKTALLIGLQEGREKSCAFLIKQGCDINIVDKLGQSTMFLASKVKDRFSTSFYKKLNMASIENNSESNKTSKDFSDTIKRLRKHITMSLTGLKGLGKKKGCSLECVKSRDDISVPSFRFLNICK